MKISRFILGALLCGYCMAQAADTIWVAGVREDAGWYDANKTTNNQDDDDLCFAAVASNLVAWWQNQLPATPNGVPQSHEAVWARYQAGSNTDAPGDVGAAVQWWLTGVYTPTDDAQYVRSSYPKTATSQFDVFDGYYYEDFIFPLVDAAASQAVDYDETLRDGYVSEFRNFMYFRAKRTNLTDNILYALQNGMALSVGLVADSNNLAHAITLWGVDYSETEGITRLWLTDSDDAQYGYNEDDGLFSVGVTQRNGKLYFDEDDNDWYAKVDAKGVYVNHIYALNPAAASDWGLPVPEPATATLGLMALMGLAARRRR